MVCSFGINGEHMNTWMKACQGFQYRGYHFYRNIREQCVGFDVMSCAEYLETSGVRFEYPTQNTYIEQ